MIFGQITQQIFVVEECYRDACKRTNAEALSRAKTEKTLGAIKQEQYELTEKLKEAQLAPQNIEASLKTMERQVEDQRQKLHVIEINLATEKQMVLDLKATLQKAEEETQLAKEVVEAEKRTAYQLGVEETQVRLTEELSEVCREYYSVTWDKALNIAGVLADTTWRLPESVFYPLKIRKVPADALEASKQPATIPDAIPLTEAMKGSCQATDQG